MTAMIAAGAILLPATTATFAASTSLNNKTVTVSKTNKRQSSKQHNSRQITAAKPAQAYQPTVSDCDISGNQVVDVNDIMELLLFGQS